MFCNWLSQKEGLDPCYEKGRKERAYEKDYYAWHLIPGTTGYRLPTEDEWEYACRAGTTTDFTCGDVSDHLRHYAVFVARSTEACASKRCNAWGLFDMHGNVQEWCQDWFEKELFGDSHRVLRGGCYEDAPKNCQSASDIGFAQWSRYQTQGFRVARDATSNKPTNPPGEAKSDSR